MNDNLPPGIFEKLDKCVDLPNSIILPMKIKLENGELPYMDRKVREIYEIIKN